MVFVGNQVSGSGIDLIKGHFAVQFAGILQFILYRHQRLSCQEVTHAGVDIVRVAVVIAHVIATFGGIEIKFLGAFQFALGETMLAGLFSNAHSGDDAAQDVVLLAADAQSKGLLGTTDKERGCASRSALDG